MTNLLPPEKKEEIIFKKKTRLIIIIGSIFAIFFSCLTLILFSLNYYLLIDISSKKSKVVNNKDLSELSEIKKELTGYNLKINNLESFYSNHLHFSKMLGFLSEIEIPEGVYIIYISSELKENKINITIYGFSDLRENLVLFKNSIEKSKIIMSPYFSPESWTKSSDINFYLTFAYEK